MGKTNSLPVETSAEAETLEAIINELVEETTAAETLAAVETDPITSVVIGMNVYKMDKSLVKSIGSSIGIKPSQGFSWNSVDDQLYATLSDGRIAILDQRGTIIGFK